MFVSYAEARLPSGAFTDGEIVDHAAVAEVLSATATAAASLPRMWHCQNQNRISLKRRFPEQACLEWRVAIEQHLDELVPLPPPETVFDIVRVGQGERGDALVTGIGFARRIIDDALSVFDMANIRVQALEGETFASSRALLPRGDESTALIIDVGRSTTK